jgi:hypothetical protein
MPLEAVESRVPSKVEVLDGTLELTADAVAPRDVDVPSVPEKMRIEVANGAILALDFPGTLSTGSLKLGGTHVVGLVNSDTHPDYICGMGTIDAKPVGSVLTIR